MCYGWLFFSVEIITGGQMNRGSEVGLEIRIGGTTLRSKTGSGGRGNTMDGGGAGEVVGGVEKGVDLHLRLGTDHQTAVLSDQRHHQCTSELIT